MLQAVSTAQTDRQTDRMSTLHFTKSEFDCETYFLRKQLLGIRPDIGLLKCSNPPKAASTKYVFLIHFPSTFYLMNKVKGSAGSFSMYLLSTQLRIPLILASTLLEVTNLPIMGTLPCAVTTSYSAWPSLIIQPITLTCTFSLYNEHAHATFTLGPAIWRSLPAYLSQPDTYHLRRTVQCRQKSIDRWRHCLRQCSVRHFDMDR